MSSLINFNFKVPVFKDNLVIARRNPMIPIQVVSALTTSLFTSSTYQSQTLLQLKNPFKDPILLNDGFDQLAFIPTGSISEKEAKHQQEVVREGRELLQRLESIVERMRVSEMEKLMARTKGDVSIEEKQVVEMMIAEIVNKFLQKPIEYLRCGDGKLEDRIKDLNVLVGMFELSCLKEEKMRSKGCLKNSHQ